MQALEGLRVLDLTRLLPGAVATTWMANFGAEIIKIEQPGIGDYARTLFTVSGENPVFSATNGGKKSVTLDLKNPRARQAFLALADQADIVIESFRPGVMSRLELGYEDLRSRNPRIIYVAITGYGQNGPWRDLAGHDLNYLALAGVLDLIGQKDGPPVIPGVQLADLAGGSMQAVLGALLALAARSRTGEGQFVDVSMMDGAAALLAVPLAQYRATGVAPRRGDEILSGRLACYQVYACRDGRYLSVGALESKFWQNLCRAIGREHLIGDQFAPEPRQSEIKRALAEIFRTRDAGQWFESLGSADCCVAPVRSMDQVASDEHFGERPLGQIPFLPSMPAGARGPAPKLGQHTVETLLGAGVSESEIQQLRTEGAI